MSNTLHIALLQSDLFWENPEKNRKNFEQKIHSIPSPIDLIILPEMFTSGFTMDPHHIAEEMGGDTHQWMKQIAKKTNAAITGSMIIKTIQKDTVIFSNRLLFIYPEGTTKFYDKKHSFTLAGEDKIYTSGNQRLTLSYKGWKICPLICYDLRFPVWSRNRFENRECDYDLLLYVANWPSPRADAWEKLLYARAIENQCYTIGVNRIGTDKKGLQYIGGSTLIDMKGKIVRSATKNKEEIIHQTIDPTSLIEFRKKFPVGRDADQFTLN